MSALLGDKHRRCPHCGGIEGATVRPLTPIQWRIYTYIKEYKAIHSYAPSFEEIASAFEYASLATVHEHLANLEAKGWILRRYNLARAIECLVETSQPELVASHPEKVPPVATPDQRTATADATGASRPSGDRE